MNSVKILTIIKNNIFTVYDIYFMLYAKAEGFRMR